MCIIYTYLPAEYGRHGQCMANQGSHYLTVCYFTIVLVCHYQLSITARRIRVFMATASRWKTAMNVAVNPVTPETTARTVTDCIFMSYFTCCHWLFFNYMVSVIIVSTKSSFRCSITPIILFNHPRSHDDVLCSVSSLSK